MGTRFPTQDRAIRSGASTHPYSEDGGVSVVSRLARVMVELHN